MYYTPWQNGYNLSETGWIHALLYHLFTKRSTQHITDWPAQMVTGGLIVTDTRQKTKIEDQRVTPCTQCMPNGRGLHGYNITPYLLLVCTSPKFHSVSLYDQSFFEIQAIFRKPDKVKCTSYTGICYWYARSQILLCVTLWATILEIFNFETSTRNDIKMWP